MGANGRRRVDELFSWRAVAAQVAQVYEETIDEFRQEKGLDTEGHETKESARADR
jgi:hypothetical protein